MKRLSSSAGRDGRLATLDPERLGDHLDQLYRAAWALCGSRHDAEDLVQETLLNVLKRPRLLRDGNEIGYLMRALRNTWASRYRTLAHRPVEHAAARGRRPCPRAERGHRARDHGGDRQRARRRIATR